MQELQIPTRSVLVEIHLDNGSSLPGCLFMTESKYELGPLEELRAVLNDERGFLPFQLREDSGETRHLILNKDRIIRVRRQESTATPGAEACHATVLLDDGSHVSGEVAVETPPSLSRLVDKLNHAQRFIPVIGEGCIDYVQSSHVMWMN